MMTTSMITRAGKEHDRKLLERVQSELRWDARVAPSEIGVTVEDGAVGLTGVVDSLTKKWAAEEAVLRVQSVRAVANDIEVQLSRSSERSDPEIAAAATHVQAWDAVLPKGEIKVSVWKGWVTLTGEVEWQFQKIDLEHVVRRLAGVRGVSNLLVIKPRVMPNEIEEQIEDALVRTAKIEAQSIRVDMEGSTVVLAGRVPSYAERAEAERIAWLGPGVSAVKNQLVVEP